MRLNHLAPLLGNTFAYLSNFTYVKIQDSAFLLQMAITSKCIKFREFFQYKCVRKQYSLLP